MTVPQEVAIPHFRKSFSRRILLLSGSLSLLSGLLVAGVGIFVRMQSLESSRREIAATKARQLAGQAAHAILAMDDIFIADALDEAVADPLAGGIALYSADGRLVLSRHRRGPVFTVVLAADGRIDAPPSRHGTGGFVDFEEPVSIMRPSAELVAQGVAGSRLDRTPQPVGRLVLRVRTRAGLDDLRSMMGFPLAMGGGVFLAGLLLAFLGTKRVWRPFQRILRGVENFRAGDLGARIQIESKDELGHIADSFNRLARDLSARMEELKQWKERLEGEVLSQTEEIQSTSRFLQELISPFEKEGETSWSELLRLLCESSESLRGVLFARNAGGQFVRIASYPAQGPTPALAPLSFDTECMEAEPGPECVGSGEAGALSVRHFNLRNPDGLGGQLILLCPKECRHQHYLKQVIPALTITLSNARAFVSVRELVAMLEKQNDVLSLQKKELEDQKNELERSSRLKSQFVANMSHELRIPLNAIIGYSEMLSSSLYGPVNGEQTSALQAIEESGRNLLNLINTILDHSRLEADRMPVYAERIDDLRKVVRETVSRNQSITREREYEIEVSVPPTPIMCISDSGKIQQILVNLVSNAVKFTETGYVRVRLEPLGDQLELVVEDSGCGIPESEFENIFAEFHQIDGSATRAAGGTGLGLAVSRKLAHLIGGTLTVASEMGKGSTFRLRLPRRIATAEAQADSII
ncbi:HAMP domain-containing protein [Myxococcota bacterium]|nr:HAMP domain-containing protein [Myxococcota bacterium]